MFGIAVAWAYNSGMKTIAVEDFRDQCLSILDQVEAGGILITKDGKPVAQLMPIRPSSAGLIGAEGQDQGQGGYHVYGFALGC